VRVRQAWVTLPAKTKMKMFRISISVGRNGLNIEGHLQAGYSSKTVKNYKPDENALTNDEPNDSIQNVEE
jgi:hypothetical protein